MKYGGVNTAVPLEDIEEAVAYVKPPVVYPLWYKIISGVLALIWATIKLIPITLLLMAIMWGLAVLIGGGV